MILAQNWPKTMKTAKSSWHYPFKSIACTRERTRAKHVFMWRQTSEFQVSNFQVFPPKCEVLLLDTAQREDGSNQQERKKLSERRPTFYDLQNQVKDLGQDYSLSVFLRSWAKVRVQFQKSFSTTLHIWAGKLQRLTLETQTFDVTWKHVLRECVQGDMQSMICYSWGPITGGLNIPYRCNFLTKYQVSHKFRSQVSRKLNFWPFFMLLATIYFIIFVHWH